MADGLRDVGGLARPGRRGGARFDAGQRARAASGAGAVRRHRDHLRSPAQRHRRRRRHLPQGRQRRAAARLVERPPLQRGGRRRAPGGRGVRRAAGRRGAAGARGGARGGQGADARPRARGRADPARRGRPDPLGGRGVDGAGDRDRRRQLPRLRRPRRRPRPGAGDRAERQDPPALGLQRRRVAARARRRRRRVRAAGGLGAAGGRRHGARRRGVRGRCDGVLAATPEDHAAEYLSLDISAAVVPDLEAAIRAHPHLLLGPHRGDRHRTRRRQPAGSPPRSTRQR